MESGRCAAQEGCCGGSNDPQLVQGRGSVNKGCRWRGGYRRLDASSYAGPPGRSKACAPLVIREAIVWFRCHVDPARQPPHASMPRKGLVDWGPTWRGQQNWQSDGCLNHRYAEQPGSGAPRSSLCSHTTPPSTRQPFNAIVAGFMQLADA